MRFNPRATLDTSRVHDADDLQRAQRVAQRKRAAQDMITFSMVKNKPMSGSSGWKSSGGGVAYVAPSKVVHKVRQHQQASAPAPVSHSSPSHANRPTAVSTYRSTTPEMQARGQAPQGGQVLHNFLQAIAEQESGGNYGAIGVPTSSGTAVGKYQILDSNFAGPGGWDAEALGRDITVPEYIGNPEYQEQIARAKLTQYFREYGPVGAAKAWYGGPGNADTNSNSPQYGGPSLNSYADSVLRRMQEQQ